MSNPTAGDFGSVLAELARAVRDAMPVSQGRDPSDWRRSPGINVIRVYALLVRTASAIAVSLPRGATSVAGNSVSCTQHDADLFTAILHLLRAFARAIERNKTLSPNLHDRGLSQALTETEDLLHKLGHDATNECGAFLGDEWETPVPPTIHGAVACMGWRSTADERAAVLSKVMASGFMGVAADFLDEASFGVASVTQLAQTFDDCSAPAGVIDQDRRYLQAAQVRVLAMHRLLLEFVGVGDRVTMLALIGLAERVAGKPTYASCFRPGVEAARVLSESRATALAVLNDEGRVSRKAKAATENTEVRGAENEVLDALYSALAVKP